ncbi:MAG: DUF3108 domain-containing protein [Candidatus Omnitrophota bacterium]|jgi:hypothetical protein
MIKKRKHYFLIVALLFLFVIIAKGAYDNRPFTIIKNNRLTDRKIGIADTISLRVNYLWVIPVGVARLENKGEEQYGNKRVYHLCANARLLGFYSRFFDLLAQADSYVDKARLHTLRFTQTLIRPNKPKEEKEILYDQEKNFMELEGAKRVILPDTHDPLSAIFSIRNQELNVGKVIDININTNQKNYRLYATVTGREEYLLKSEKAGVWVIEGTVKRREKNPYHRTTLKLWLMDDAAKTPVLIKAMTNAGPITARLSMPVQGE